jgi:HK97 family phage portal protein
MKIFGYNFSIKKSYEQLRQMIVREKMDGGNLLTGVNQQLDAYRSWVYSCVTLISDRVSTIPFKFYNKDTGEELSTKNKNFKTFTKPFYHPNDLMTFRFIMQFCQIQLDLTGMSVLYPVKNVLGQVWELWPMNMVDFVKTEVSNSMINPSVKYIFKSGKGGWIDFDISELIVVNYPNPKNPYDPMSPIQAQAYATDLDKYIEIYERDFFKNSARTDFALTTEVPIDQDKADEIKSRWKEKYRGVFHDVAVLDSGLKPVQLSFANKDFEFLNLAKWSKDKVLACYRVPESKLGGIDSNRAGSVQSDISFNRESIGPRLFLWDEELTEGVCKTFDERLQIKHDNPIPRDRQLEVLEAKTYLGGLPAMTINEYRKDYLNKPPKPEGDRLLIPNKYIDIEDIDKVTAAAVRPDRSGNGDDNTGGDTRPAPDGSDPRDDNPTDGRSISGQANKKSDILTIEAKARESWNTAIIKFLSSSLSSIPNNTITDDIFVKNTSENIKSGILSMMGVFGEHIFNISEKEINNLCKEDPWLDRISIDISKRYFETLIKVNRDIDTWEDHVKFCFDSNPRLSKINNYVIRAALNFVKYIVLHSENKPMVWLVNSNECGHRGRIKEKKSFDTFKLGIHQIRFPGEIFSLSCDCELILDKGE